MKDVATTGAVPLDAASRRKAIVGGVLGNAVEFLDFAIYGLLAGTISRVFFPAGDPTAALLAAMLVYTASFVVRPLGGIVLGTGDYIRALGHEAVGVVEAVGEDVTSVGSGKPVIISWIPGVGTTRERAIHSAQAELSDGAIAQTPDVFTWATRTLIDEAYVFPLSEPVGPEMSIVGCAVPTGAGAVLHTGGVVPGQTVAVIGVGGVGINAVAAAKAAGAAAIIAVDIDSAKLAYAGTLGATKTINTTGQSTERVLAEHGLTDIDLVIDCVATQATLDLAIDMVRPGTPGVREGGAVVLVGVARNPLTIDARRIQMQEKRLLVRRLVSGQPRFPAISAVGSGRGAKPQCSRQPFLPV